MFKVCAAVTVVVGAELWTTGTGLVFVVKKASVCVGTITD